MSSEMHNSGIRYPLFAAKIICFFILILLLIPFQLYLMVYAGQKIPVLESNAARTKVSGTLLKRLGDSGYNARLVQPEDFLLGSVTRGSRYVIVPLHSDIDSPMLATLESYVAGGGKLILFPTGDTPDASTQKLLHLVGLQSNGLIRVPDSAKFTWQDAILPGEEGLPPQATVLSVKSDIPYEMLATWGGHVPAIIRTAHGALINWQWGQQLSSTTNTVALSKVTPMERWVAAAYSRTRSFAAGAAAPIQPEEAPSLSPNYSPNPILHDLARSGASQTVYSITAPPNANAPQSDTQAASTDGNATGFGNSSGVGNASNGGNSTSVGNSSYGNNSVAGNASNNAARIPAEGNQSAQSSQNTGRVPLEGLFLPTTAITPSPTLKPETPASIAIPVQPSATRATTAFSANHAHAASTQAATAAKSPVTHGAASQGATATKSAPTIPTMQPAATKPATVKTSDIGGDEAEVINNILGAPVVPENKTTIPTGPVISPTTGDVVPSPKAEKPQQHFSFLDPGAAEVLAPSFDYGVYSVGMRVLANYRQRVLDAEETARQLAVDLPKDRIDVLLQEANNHKRQFEALYLGSQTQQGLNEYGQAKRILLQALSLASTSPQVEGRAIWLDRATIIDSGSPEGLRRLMRKLHDAGINIVYFETLNAGFPIYPSKILKNNPLVKGWDPLAVAVDEGHKDGMEVHAWVWVFAVGNRRHNALVGMPSDYSGPILNEGGMMSEALRNRGGGLNVDNRQNEFWISPASPKGREFLLNIYKEIVTNYHVDGLHLDYIRYPFQTGGNRMGYEDFGRERFYQATGRTLDTLDDYTSRLWVAWKTYQVSSFVQQVSETTRRINPNIKLSAAVFPMRRAARIVAIQQDWETWIDNGWIDTLSPMSYTTDPERLQGLFDYVQHSPQKRSLIYPGIALGRLDGGQLLLQLDALRAKGSLGSTLFAGAQLDAEKAETLGNGPYKDKSTLPPHHDVVKSLQLILTDSQQKVARLSAMTGPDVISPDQAQSLQSALNAFASSLTPLVGARTIGEMSPDKVQTAQRQFKALQAAMSPWLVSDRTTHAFRAQYFEQKLQVLDELVAYLVDKNTSALAGSPTPGFSAAAMGIHPPTAETAAANAAKGSAPNANTTADPTTDDDSETDPAAPMPVTPTPSTSQSAHPKAAVAK